MGSKARTVSFGMLMEGANVPPIVKKFLGRTVYYIRPSKDPGPWPGDHRMAEVDIGKVLSIQDFSHVKDPWWRERMVPQALVEWYVSGRVWIPVQLLSDPHEVLADYWDAKPDEFRPPGVRPFPSHVVQ